MSDKRLFIALPLPKDIKEKLAGVQQLLEPISEGVKWVEEDNLHITLKFLGETPERMMDEVIDEFDRICENIEPFELQIKDLGQFPKDGDPKILWAGLQKVPPVVYRLSDEFNTGYLSMGFDNSGKKFAPHISLARTKSKLHEELIPSYYDIQLEASVFKVDKIVLYESTHKRGALKYTPVKEYLLK